MSMPLSPKTLKKFAKKSNADWMDWSAVNASITSIDPHAHSYVFIMRTNWRFLVWTIHTWDSGLIIQLSSSPLRSIHLMSILSSSLFDWTLMLAISFFYSFSSLFFTLHSLFFILYSFFIKKCLIFNIFLLFKWIMLMFQSCVAFKN